MKVEVWNGYEIRFVEKDGEWWAVLKDVCDALGLRAKKVAERLPKVALSRGTLETSGGPQEMLLVSEKGIYKTVFKSRKPEAEAFQDWVMDVLVELRKAADLEGFQIFRMLDKEHQNAAMAKIRQGVKPVDAVSYIKANTIANKAVSNRHGLSKMVKKDDMTPEMLMEREAILDETVELMIAQKKYNLNISVSKSIYGRWN